MWLDQLYHNLRTNDCCQNNRQIHIALHSEYDLNIRLTKTMTFLSETSGSYISMILGM